MSATKAVREFHVISVDGTQSFLLRETLCRDIHDPDNPPTYSVVDPPGQYSILAMSRHRYLIDGLSFVEPNGGVVHSGQYVPVVRN